MTDEPDPTASKGYQLTDTAEVELEDVLGFVADRDGVPRALHVHGKFVVGLRAPGVPAWLRNDQAEAHRSTCALVAGLQVDRDLRSDLLPHLDPARDPRRT